LTRRVVGVVEDASLEISLEDAREIKPEVRPGEELLTELDIQEFGRGAATAAKQVLIQRVREAERERVYEEFHDRVGELVHGVVQQVDRRNVLMRVDGVEAILPEREALFRDRFRQGDHITAMLLDVDRMAKGPQVALSRSHPDFLRRLFEHEVPEIAEKIVEIRSIARESGSRSKVAVFSHDDRVDAVGACVGVKGSRVQNVVRELGGERIDIVPWSSDPALFVTRALSPAKVQRVDVDEDTGGVSVIVPDDQLSLAIGKGGQNVRLAMKLTSWNIELVSDQQLAEARAPEEAADFDLEEIEDRLGPKLTERLIQAGLETARDVLSSSEAGLQEIEGIGPKTADKVMTAVREVYAERLEKVDEVVEETPAEEEGLVELPEDSEDLEDDDDETASATAAAAELEEILTEAAPPEADEATASPDSTDDVTAVEVTTETADDEPTASDEALADEETAKRVTSGIGSGASEAAETLPEAADTEREIT
jgi:N utilization substance protein A